MLMTGHTKLGQMSSSFICMKQLNGFGSNYFNSYGWVVTR